MIHISQEELFRKIESEHDCRDRVDSFSAQIQSSNISSGSRRGSKSLAKDELDESRRSSRGTSICSAGSPLSETSSELLGPNMSSLLLKQQAANDALHHNTHQQQQQPPNKATTSHGIKDQDRSNIGMSDKSSSSSKDKNNNSIPHTSSNLTQASSQAQSTISQQQQYDQSQQQHHHQTATPAQTIVGAKDEDKEVQAVLITGCGSKIGTNIAVAFAAQGLKVALVDFDIQQTEAVARECQEKSPKNRVPLQIVADMSQLSEAHKVIDRTIDAFGRLDVLVNTVNNAGLMEAKFNASGDDDPHVFEQYHKIIANNMHSVTYLCISAAPYLRKTKGTIVNVSSITNNETGSYNFAHCMSKAGISTLTKCLATDLAPDIKVICVSPKSDVASA